MRVPKISFAFESQVFIAGLFVFAIWTCAFGSVRVDPLSCDFGKVAIYRSSPGLGARSALHFFVEEPVTITNTGSDPLHIASVRIEPKDAGFSLVSDTCSGKVIEPGSSCTLIIRFMPLTAGGKAAKLVVDTPEGLSLLVVPMWGEGYELVCQESVCEASPVDFGSACPPASRVKAIGFRNDTDGEILASVTLDSPDETFKGKLPLPRAVKPGEEFKASFTCVFDGEPGSRQAMTTWSVPPPMLPVVKEVKIPLTARIRPCISKTGASEIRARGGREISLLRRKKKYHLEAWDSGVGVRLAAVVEAAGRKAIAIGRRTQKAGGRAAFRWDLFTESGFEEQATLGVFAMARPAVLPRQKEVDKASPRLWICGSRKAWKYTQEGAFREKDLKLAPTREIIGPFALSSVSKSRVYAVIREKNLKGGIEGWGRINLRLKKTSSGRREEVLAFRKIGDLPEIAGRKAIEVRAMDTTAVFMPDGSWEDLIGIAARYGAGEEVSLNLVLRNSKGEVLGTYAPRTGWGWRGLADLLLVRVKEPPLCGSDLPQLLKREMDGNGCADLACPRIRFLMGFRDGSVASLFGRMLEDGSWVIAPEDCKGAVSVTSLGRRIASLVRRKGIYASFERKSDVFAIGGRYISILGRKKDYFELAGRVAIEFPFELVTAVRPKTFGIAKAEARKKDYYALASRPDNSYPTIFTFSGVDQASVAGGAHGEPPVLYPGDTVIYAEADPGSNSATVSLQAYAYDPEGEELYWSWTAPGIEFDDPTSDQPQGTFPLGETLVFVVVRDGPPDDPTDNETGPALIRVIVQEAQGCGESYFDVNGDGSLDLADAVFTLAYLFGGGPAPERLESADMNADGSVDISDVIYLLLYLFAGGAPPICP